MARDRFAPNFQILINDQPLTDSFRPLISNITVEDESDRMDQIKITFSTLRYTEKNNVMDLIDKKIFMPGQVVKIYMGYGTETDIVGVGEIVRIIPNFGRGGASLTVTCYDCFHRLADTKHREIKKFKDTNLVDVFASVIAGQEHPIVGDLVVKILEDKNVKAKKDQTVGTNDYQFLKSLAETKGLDFFTRWNDDTQAFDIHLEEPADKEKPLFLFQYFIHNDDPDKTLLDFQPQMNTKAQVTDVEIISHNPATKSKINTYIEVQNTDGTSDIKFAGPDQTSSVSPVDNGAQVRFRAFGRSIDVISNKAFKNEKEAKIFAENWLKKRMDDFIFGSGSVIGVEKLRSRMVVKLDGIGEIFKGNYYITRLSHTQTGNNIYETKIDCRKVVELQI